jgi:hypothetical protein
MMDSARYDAIRRFEILDLQSSLPERMIVRVAAAMRLAPCKASDLWQIVFSASLPMFLWDRNG